MSFKGAVNGSTCETLFLALIICGSPTDYAGLCPAQSPKFWMTLVSLPATANLWRTLA